MILRIKVTPNARKSQLLGWADHPDHGRHLRIALAAPPVDGKANKALLAFLAKQVGTSKSSLSLKNGTTSRFKTIELPNELSLQALEVDSGDS